MTNPSSKIVLALINRDAMVGDIIEAIRAIEGVYSDVGTPGSYGYRTKEGKAMSRLCAAQELLENVLRALVDGQKAARIASDDLHSALATIYAGPSKATEAAE